MIGAESVDGAVQIGVEAHGVDPVRAELSHHRDVSGQVTHVGVLSDHHAFTQGDLAHLSSRSVVKRSPPQLAVIPEGERRVAIGVRHRSQHDGDVPQTEVRGQLDEGHGWHPKHAERLNPESFHVLPSLVGRRSKSHVKRACVEFSSCPS